jgi:leucine dehydrogenase
LEDLETHRYVFLYVLCAIVFLVPSVLKAFDSCLQIPTAMGIRVAMEAALDFLGMGSLKGKTVAGTVTLARITAPDPGRRFAVQGLGNVGSPLVSFLLDAGVAHILAADVDADRVEAARKAFKGKPV